MIPIHDLNALSKVQCCQVPYTGGAIRHDLGRSSLPPLTPSGFRPHHCTKSGRAAQMRHITDSFGIRQRHRLLALSVDAGVDAHFEDAPPLSIPSSLPQDVNHPAIH